MPLVPETADVSAVSTGLSRTELMGLFYYVYAGKQRFQREVFREQALNEMRVSALTDGACALTNLVNVVIG